MIVSKLYITSTIFVVTLASNRNQNYTVCNTVGSVTVKISTKSMSEKELMEDEEHSFSCMPGTHLTVKLIDKHHTVCYKEDLKLPIDHSSNDLEISLVTHVSGQFRAKAKTVMLE